MSFLSGHSSHIIQLKRLTNFKKLKNTLLELKLFKIYVVKPLFVMFLKAIIMSLFLIFILISIEITKDSTVEDVARFLRLLGFW